MPLLYGMTSYGGSSYYYGVIFPLILLVSTYYCHGFWLYLSMALILIATFYTGKRWKAFSAGMTSQGGRSGSSWCYFFHWSSLCLIYIKSRRIRSQYRWWLFSLGQPFYVVANLRKDIRYGIPRNKQWCYFFLWPFLTPRIQSLWTFDIYQWRFSYWHLMQAKLTESLMWHEFPWRGAAIIMRYFSIWSFVYSLYNAKGFWY